MSSNKPSEPWYAVVGYRRGESRKEPISKRLPNPAEIAQFRLNIKLIELKLFIERIYKKHCE